MPCRLPTTWTHPQNESPQQQMTLNNRRGFKGRRRRGDCDSTGKGAREHWEKEEKILGHMALTFLVHMHTPSFPKGWFPLLCCTVATNTSETHPSRQRYRSWHCRSACLDGQPSHLQTSDTKTGSSLHDDALRGSRRMQQSLEHRNEQKHTERLLPKV